MKALQDLIKRLPKGSAARLVGETALKGLAEHDREFERERERSERKREQLRRDADAGIDELLKRP